MTGSWAILTEAHRNREADGTPEVGFTGAEEISPDHPSCCQRPANHATASSLC